MWPPKFPLLPRGGSREVGEGRKKGPQFRGGRGGGWESGRKISTFLRGSVCLGKGNNSITGEHGSLHRRTHTMCLRMRRLRRRRPSVAADKILARASQGREEEKLELNAPILARGGDRPTSTEPPEARPPCPPNPSLPHPPPTDPPPPPSIIKKFPSSPASSPQTFWPQQLGCQSRSSPLRAYKEFNCSHFKKKLI